ncbi:hypothetical protein RhiirA1_480750 [Rhizophagus irregularis]|uniref:Uncharacterized protein n=1 Tax=Rhizophagus irregularis TaxID=588596 RepID=A0A2N0QNZ7_9GLOM|nr:hypothetical protein RhiirA1_480750 [Rhizophagus irregularis]
MIRQVYIDVMYGIVSTAVDWRREGGSVIKFVVTLSITNQQGYIDLVEPIKDLFGQIESQELLKRVKTE